MDYEYKKRFLVNVLFVAAIIGAGVCFLRYIPGYFFPFIIGILIAFLVQRPAVFFSEKFHIKKDVSAVILTVGVCAVFFTVLVLLIFAVGNRLMDILPSLPEYFSNIEEYLFSTKDGIMKNFHALTQTQKNSIESIISQTADSFLSSVTRLISAFATGLIKNLPAFLITSIVTVVASCYIAKDFDRLKKFTTGIFSAQRADMLREIKRALQDNTFKFLKGYILIALITFAELTVAFLVLGVSDPIYVSLIVTTVDILPVLGVGTVLLPWSVIEFLGHNYSLGIGLLISYCIVIVVRNFIEPRIIGSQMGINPIFTLFSMFIGLKIAGIGGMIMGPLALTVAISYYRNREYP